jgi:hypothetical protein
VSIIRIGSNDKYASGWEAVFSKGKKATSSATKSSAKKKSPKKTAKKASKKK